MARLSSEPFHAPETVLRTIAYARVSSHDRKDDLERQKQVLERYCARQGWTFEVIADLGSGMNYHKQAEQAQQADKMEREVLKQERNSGPGGSR